jgi:hypothetical protein
MAKTKRTKANKSDQPLEDDLSAENLEPAFAVSDRKITVRRDGGKVVVSVPVRFYRRNGRQMILADSIESDSIEAAVPNNALLTALAKAYAWQEQLESGQFWRVRPSQTSVCSIAGRAFRSFGKSNGEH